ncbi:MAG: chitobiase/beta-hexosaminidase C-terminal domain-containing protein [Terracidiphilus sp.]
MVLAPTALTLLCFFAVSSRAQTPTPVPSPTWRYDITHEGQNTQETALTPANVNVNSFGKLFSLGVDSTVYAQPLYIPGLTMSDGQVHNVIFVATENDSIYAFDADSNGGSNASPIWKITLLDAAHGAGAGATAVPADPQGIKPQGDIGPTIGITGTPVINPATNTMYVVGNTLENGTYFSRLHAINILTGAEQSSPTVQTSPVVIAATVPGTGEGSSGGQLAFDPLIENQRPALDYYNGYVYVGYAAHGDIGPFHGWLFAYNATTMAQSAALCLSPNDYGSGIWGSGAGLPIDDDATGGRMFVSTGNGTHTTVPPFNANTEYGESIVTFDLANGGLTPTDEFTSYNYQDLNDSDLDQGAGGVLMIPDQSGANPHILVEAGKEGRILVLNRDNLGGFNSGGTSNTNALQDITGEIGGMWATPAYWNGNVYIWASKDYPKLFPLTNGVLANEPASQSSIYSAFPGPSFSISSNGTQNGIAWAVRADQYVTYGEAVLYAWPANNLSTPLYESDTNSARDSMGTATKFSIPLVTNGKVYVVAQNEVDVYGLFNGEPSAAAPTISPNGGTFAATQSVTLTTATPSSQIFYSLDGSTPTPASNLYTGPISISTDTTLKAITSAAGYIQSAISSAVFNFTDQTPLISFSPAGGTYASAQMVTLSDSDANAKIYYTIDGSTPSASSTLYASPIKVAISETINAIAIDPSLANSDIGTAAYVIQAGGTTISFPNGFASTAGLTLNGSTKASNDSRMQLTDGGLNEAGSVFWNTPINIQAFTSVFTFQLSEAQANGFTFTIQNNSPTALGGDSAGLGYQNIPNSVAIKFNFYNYENEGSDSTGFYTNGEPPVTPTVDISPSGIQLNSDDGITATVTYDGTTLTLNLLDGVTGDKFTYSQAINIPQTVGANTAYVGFTGGSGGLSASQKILSWTYTTQALPPIFTPAAGTYGAAQSVALSSATSDAAIYYTTDGSSPSAGSPQYSTPISVGASETIEAIAISPSVGTSMIEKAAYVIQSTAGSGTFSLSAAPPAAIAQGSSTTSSLTITPSGGFTGSVALTCAVSAGASGTTDAPTCSVSAAPAISGTAAVTSILTISTQATTSTGAYTLTVTGTAGGVSETTTVSLTIVLPSVFTLSGTAATVASAGGSAASTITITPSGGFTGTVTLTCAVTSSPAGAMDPPTCTAAQPAVISGSSAVTSTITISTTGASTAALHDPFNRNLALGGGTLAAFLIFCLPLRRRKWQTLLCLVLFSAIAALCVGCVSGVPANDPSNAGTTAGNYVVTVTGTSGTASVTTTINLTVN